MAQPTMRPRIAAPAVWHCDVPRQFQNLQPRQSPPRLPSRRLESNQRVTRNPRPNGSHSKINNRIEDLSPPLKCSEESTMSNNVPSITDKINGPIQDDEDFSFSSDSDDNESVFEIDSDSEAEFRAFQEFRKDASASTCFVCSTSQPNVTTLRSGEPAHIQCLHEMTCHPSDSYASRTVDCKNVIHEARFRDKARFNQMCLICLQGFPDVATLCCGKVMHVECMAQWLDRKDSCPNCRKKLSSSIPSTMLIDSLNFQDVDESSSYDSSDDDLTVSTPTAG